MVAFAKLQELIGGRPIVYPGQKLGNMGLLAGLVAVGIVIVAGPQKQILLVAIILGALAFGVLFVLPIGGADMPVVISLLNAFTGVAASATGFVLHQNVLIVSGMLVGASGTLLTLMMARRWAARSRTSSSARSASCRSRPRAASLPATAAPCARPRAEDVAVMLAYARPRDHRPRLRARRRAGAARRPRARRRAREARGVDVKYAIHPVAGRMPGHMNVLLAEANVPYDQLKEMDEINPEFEQTDVALVIGANDVTNPAARNDTGSPIYGMPILDVDKAQNVVVLKRSMNPGFAGIDNPLYVDPKTVMLFGDAKASRSSSSSPPSRRPSAPALPRPGRLRSGLARAGARGRPRGVRRLRARRVVDAAEGLRPRLSGRRLPGDAGARRRATRR